jgi:D-tyrosyl-tRNA(Tyr) deacylase
LLALVCAERGDTEAEADKLLAKMLKLRIFSDEAGKMNKSLQDIGGGLLVVSQFTLAADTRGGNRPSFTAPPRPTKAGASTTTLWTRPGCPRSGADRRVCRRHAGASGQ